MSAAAKRRVDSDQTPCAAAPSFDRAKVGRLLDFLREGNYRDTACLAAGSPRPTFYDWLAKAETDPVLRQFAEDVIVAEAEAETSAIEYIRKAYGKECQWQARAWFLERRYRNRWGRPKVDDAEDPSKLPDDKLIDGLLERLLANPATAERVKARLEVLRGGKA